MGTLDRKVLDIYKLDNFTLDKYAINNYQLDGIITKMGGIDSYTKLMLHMNGTNGSTTFTDDELTPKTFTRYGSAQISTAQSKFGGASGLFNGSTDYIDTPDSSDFDVGNGDFTIDCWIKKLTNGSRQCVFAQCDNTFTANTLSFSLELYTDDKVLVNICSGSTYYALFSSSAITDTNWHHIAMVRSGNSLMVFIDGVQSGTLSVTGVTANNSPNKIAIGRPGEYNGEYFNGYIDEFRFSKGVARWTTNFTPPTTEYTT